MRIGMHAALGAALWLGLSGLGHAQDKLELGSVSDVSAGATVDLPVRVVDAAGTPLGADQGAGKAIQGLTFQLEYSPKSAVSTIEILRGADLPSGTIHPIDETTRKNGDLLAYLASYHELYNPVPASAAPGTEWAKVRVLLAASAAAGTSVTLTLVPESAMLSNQTGTLYETTANKQLEVSNGGITIKGGGGGDLPVVIVTTIKPIAIERGRHAARFKISCTGKKKNKQLKVRYTLSGAAQNGKDYRRLKKSAVIPAGKRAVNIVVKPILDKLAEAAEDVILTLNQSAKYQIGTPEEAAVTIQDQR